MSSRFSLSFSFLPRRRFLPPYRKLNKPLAFEDQDSEGVKHFSEGFSARPEGRVRDLLSPYSWACLLAFLSGRPFSMMMSETMEEGVLVARVLFAAKL